MAASDPSAHPAGYPRSVSNRPAPTATTTATATAAATAGAATTGHWLFSPLRRIQRAMGEGTVELTVLRICCVAMSVALLAYLGLQYATYGSGYIGDWYGYLISIGLAACGVFMVVAAGVGKRSWLRYSLYANAVVLIVATLLFPVAYYTIVDIGPAVLQFTDFTGIVAISVVLLNPTTRAVLVAILIQVIPSTMVAFISGRSSLPELLAVTGFAVLMSLIPFVLGALALMQVARTIDTTEQRVRESLAESESKRAAITERKRLNGLIHDHILASLSAISRGQSLHEHTTGSLPSRPATGEDIPVATLLAGVRRSVRRITPDCTLTVTGLGTDATPSDVGISTIKDSAAEAIRLSVTEAALNSRKHAGMDCRRRCTITVANDEFTVVFTDDGAGFDMATRDPQRAGINVSILHRMRSIDGGDAEVTSAPGAGTTVTVRWCLAAADAELHNRLATHADDIDGITENRLLSGDLEQRLLHPAQVSRSWARPYLGLAVVSIVSAAWVSSGDFATALPAALAAIITLAMLLLDDSLHITGLKRLAITVCFLTIGPLSLWQRAAYNDAWGDHWALAIITLISCIIVLRGEIYVGIIGFLGNAVSLKAITILSDGEIVSPAIPNIVIHMNLIAAAAVVYLSNSYILKNLPRLRAQKRTANAEAARIRQIHSVHNHWHERIELHAAPVFEAVQHFQAPPPLLRERARLTELAIRDMIRAPLLDRPELTAAVWDARAAGATVLLLDDRSERDASNDGRDSDGRDAGAALERLVPVALERLNYAGTDSVTIRVLPPGRKDFAMITTESNGVTRVPFPMAD